MSEINQKIDAISQIVVADLLESVQKEGNLEDSTFILAGVIANICGWYTATLNEIQPSLNDIFHGMICQQREAVRRSYKIISQKVLTACDD